MLLFSFICHLLRVRVRVCLFTAPSRLLLPHLLLIIVRTEATCLHMLLQTGRSFNISVQVVASDEHETPKLEFARSPGTFGDSFQCPPCLTGDSKLSLSVCVCVCDGQAPPPC